MKQWNIQKKSNNAENPDSNTNQLDELSVIEEEEEEEESQLQGTEATETAAESEYYDEMDAHNATEDTIIPVTNADPEMPETNTVPSTTEEVGCSFLTS